MVKSELEQTFLALWDVQSKIHRLNLPSPQREHRFHPKRKWRFDFAWPDKFVAVEIDVGGWVSGRHNLARGQIGDMDKANAAVLAGWKVLRFSGDHLRRDPDGVFMSVMTALGAFDHVPS